MTTPKLKVTRTRHGEFEMNLMFADEVESVCGKDFGLVALLCDVAFVKAKQKLFDELMGVIDDGFEATLTRIPESCQEALRLKNASELKHRATNMRPMESLSDGEPRERLIGKRGVFKRSFNPDGRGNLLDAYLTHRSVGFNSGHAEIVIKEQLSEKTCTRSNVGNRGLGRQLKLSDNLSD